MKPGFSCVLGEVSSGLIPTQSNMMRIIVKKIVCGWVGGGERIILKKIVGWGGGGTSLGPKWDTVDIHHH